jgi:hypothetical protein
MLPRLSGIEFLFSGHDSSTLLLSASVQTLALLTRHKLSHGSGRRKWQHGLPLFEIARVLVRLNHVASFIVNANHRNNRVNPTTRSLQ